jgi:hypothetical protein
MNEESTGKLFTGQREFLLERKARGAFMKVEIGGTYLPSFSVFFQVQIVK